MDINPATRPVVTGTETFTREVCRRLPAAAPELRWRFLASRPKAGLGVAVGLTRAKMDVTTSGDTTIRVDAGGVHVGGGLRLRF